jgi:hypothetical protein
MVRWLLCFILAVQAAVARGEFGATAPVEFPFEYREGLLWVQVQVAASREPLRFLLDSGAEVSVLNLDTAKRLRLSLGERVNVSSVQTTMTGYWPQELSANASGVRLPTAFLALDLSRLNRACEQSVDGLIGADFFKGRIVQIDFGAQKIRLLNTNDTAKTEASPLEVRRCGLCVKASVNGGKPQRLRVDTGCATALQWVTSKVQPERCTSKVAIGLAELNIPQTRTTVSVAGRTFSDVPTGLHREAIFDGEAGLLGNGLLSRFEMVTIDSRAGRLSFGRLRESP